MNVWIVIIQIVFNNKISKKDTIYLYPCSIQYFQIMTCYAPAQEARHKLAPSVAVHQGESSCFPNSVYALESFFSVSISTIILLPSILTSHQMRFALLFVIFGEKTASHTLLSRSLWVEIMLLKRICIDTFLK